MWVDHMARTLNMTPEAIRERNLMREGDVTHFGQVMESNQVHEEAFSISLGYLSE